jgi:nitrite reductase/ring-hydroxylating ferredoxin subunit
MLSEADNEILTRVGPGTLMGNLLRRYWLPALLSTEVPEADSPPVRVRLLCEDLVAYRDTRGDVGLLVAACPHRGASLFFGRNEEAGLRCVYHGWKFDTTGACTDMPSEPAESNFKAKVRAKAYPTHESGGIVWTYMGPPEHQKPFRNFGSDDLPREQWRATKLLTYCNYVQAMEGNLDTSHISYLHRNLGESNTPDDGTDQPGYPSQEMSSRIKARDGAPRVEVHETPYGFRYAGIRTTPNGHTHIRLTDFAMPVMTFVSALPIGGGCGMFVPIDDTHCWRYGMTMHSFSGSPGRFDPIQTAILQKQPQTPGPAGISQRYVEMENGYLQDREEQRNRTYTGIPGVVQQDLAVTESMGAIYERNHEHLGTTDAAIIKMRSLLVRAAKELARGIEPRGLDPSYPYHLIRSAEKIISPGEDWRALGTPADAAVAQYATVAV